MQPVSLDGLHSYHRQAMIKPWLCVAMRNIVVWEKVAHHIQIPLSGHGSGRLGFLVQGEKDRAASAATQGSRALEQTGTSQMKLLPDTTTWLSCRSFVIPKSTTHTDLFIQQHISPLQDLQNSKMTVCFEGSRVECLQTFWLYRANRLNASNTGLDS